jgi:hypothetical protein
MRRGPPRPPTPRPAARVCAQLVVSAALATSLPAAADGARGLARFPVVGTTRVDSESYASASTVARNGGAPVEIALAVAGPFEGKLQHVLQANERAEAPSACRVTVMRDGLLDDSIRGERWDVALGRAADGTWRIDEVRRSWLCRRGERRNRFVATNCP